MALTACAMAMPFAAAAQEQRVDLSIASMPADRALRELAIKTGRNILFVPATVEGVVTRKLEGRVTAEEAARRMLAGIDVEVIRDRSGAILIQPRAPKQAPLDQAARSRRHVQFASLAMPQSIPVPADEPAPSEGVPDIVVTAQKRTQNLQQVPISISALTAGALEANRIQNVRDLNAVAPNLTVRTSAGGLAAPSYSMRGIVSAATAPGSDKGISLYLDNVYIGPSMGSLMDVADIERIEVLKGPQGTLFGRNATGGAISIITRDPTGEFHVRQDLTYGNYDQFRSKTRVDLPAFGPLSLSGSYTHSKRRGDMRNLGAGTVWDFSAVSGRRDLRTSPKYLGDQNVEAFNVAAKLDASPDFDLVYKFDWSENRFTADGQAPVFLNPGALGPGFGGMVEDLLAAQPDSSLLTPVSVKRPDAVNNAFTTPGLLRNQGHNLTARWRLSDTVSFKNVLAYRKTYVTSTTELDGLGGLVSNGAPAFGPAGQPIILLGTNSTQNEHQWSNEFQVNVTTPWFDLTGGFLHFDEYVSLLSDGIQFASLPDHMFPDRGMLPSQVNIISNAVFGQGEFHVLPKLDLVVGGRLTWDRKYGDDNTILGTTTAFTYQGDKPSWLVGANYQPRPGILLYGKFTTGYISGGYLATLAYGPETAKSWEGGLKADWFDRRLRTNLAVFHVTYRGMQYTGSGLNFGVPAALQVIVNGGDGRAQGFEFESTAVPIDGLTMQANVGYTDFKYTRINPLVGSLNSYRPIFRPKWTGSGSIQYESGEIALGGHLLARVDANYQSKSYQTFLPLSPSLLDAATVGNSWVVNGRLALSGIDLARSKAQIALWGRNLTNNRSQSFGTAIAFIHPTSYERARTYGVDLSIEF